MHGTPDTLSKHNDSPKGSSPVFICRLAFIFICLHVSALLPAQSLTVGTLAGGTTGGGYVDANGTDARFSAPRGVTRDSAGNLYVADSSSHVIRKVSVNGDVTTLAGLADAPGYAEGTGTLARFRFPMGITWDSVSGDLYVADKDNHVIRRVTLTGTTSSIAGLGGTSGTGNGNGSAARFTFPRALTTDNSGAIYVADTVNHVIRRIGPDRSVTTVAGVMRSIGSSDGFGDQARFNYPYGVATDPSNGNLYVSDALNNTVRKVTPEGRVTTIAGSPGVAGKVDAVGSDARFDFPWGLDVDLQGNVFVADEDNNSIRKITPSGIVTTVAGTGSRGPIDGDRTRARFNSPSDIVVLGSGDLAVADGYNHAVRRVSSDGTVTTIAGSMASNGTANGSSALARFHYPYGVAADQSGNVYVSEANATIRKISPDGVVSTLAGGTGQPGSIDGIGTSARFRSPLGLAVGPDGKIYVADGGNHTIRRITPAGVVSTVAGLAGESGYTNGTGSQARFDTPWGVAVDSRGDIYVADAYNHAIRLVEASGVVTTFAGGGFSGARDGVGTDARFYYPLAIAVDANRSIFVADWGNNAVRRITQSGVVSTIAGDMTAAAGWADGTGKVARFDSPSGIVADGRGGIFVGDEYNHAVRYITPQGETKTVAGLPGIPGNVNGTGTIARFAFPQMMAMTPTGRVIIVDADNHAVRVGDFAAPSIDTFVGTPTFIGPGESAILTYSVRNATTVAIDNGVGSVASTGQKTVSPAETTTYTLTASGPGGVVSATVRIAVGTGTRRRAARH